MIKTQDIVGGHLSTSRSCITPVIKERTDVWYVTPTNTINST